MIPTTRTEFKEYCLRKLGEPVIKVNISIEQMDDRIDEALSYFNERHYDGSEVIYLIHEITDDEQEAGFLSLPNDVLGVTDIFRLNMSNSGLFSTEFQYQLQDMYTGGAMSMYRMGDVSYWYMMNAHLSLINKYFSPSRSFQYNEYTNRLTILGGLNNSTRIDGGYIGIKAYKKVLGEASVSPTAGNTERIANIYQNRWLQQYCSALFMKQWGQNLSKFQNVQLIGGVTMNGTQLAENAQLELDKLEIELDSRYRPVMPFLVG